MPGLFLTLGLVVTVFLGTVFSGSARAEPGLLLKRGGEMAWLEALTAGRPAILHFWATWCAPCRDELPALDRFVAEAGDAGVLVVISVDTADHRRVRAFIEDELGLDHLKSWQVAKGNAGSAFGLFGYPATLMVDGTGAVSARFAGPVDWEDAAVRDRLRRHLAGFPADPGADLNP